MISHRHHSYPQIMCLAGMTCIRLAYYQSLVISHGTHECLPLNSLYQSSHLYWYQRTHAPVLVSIHIWLLVGRLKSLEMAIDRKCCCPILTHHLSKRPFPVVSPATKPLWSIIPGQFSHRSLWCGQCPSVAEPDKRTGINQAVRR